MDEDNKIELKPGDLIVSSNGDTLLMVLCERDNPDKLTYTWLSEKRNDTGFVGTIAADRNASKLAFLIARGTLEVVGNSQSFLDAIQK